MTIEDLRGMFENSEIQIHVKNTKQWDACVNLLKGAGVEIGFDEDEWRGRANYFVRGHHHTGLNYEYKPQWGSLVEFSDIVIEQPAEFYPATQRDILSLIGM